MTLTEIYNCARSLEAVENYARVDASFSEAPENDSGPQRPWPKQIDEDKGFWYIALNNDSWGMELNFFHTVMSEWVARIPGLYYSKGAEALRSLGASQIEINDTDWETYTPTGKSRLVNGGIGTIKLSPDENGRRLVSISQGQNASSGIPWLVDPDIWDKLKLREGKVLDITAKWQPMTLGWAERFESTRGIPRGYLTLSHPEQLNVYDVIAPTQFHPFTVMEYSKGDAKLYDFVYSTADSAYPNWRKKTEQFFEEYKNKHERYGRYPLIAEINERHPFWEAEYNSPAELKRQESGAKSNLELLQARVRNECFKDKTIEDIVQFLAHNFNPQELVTTSGRIGIPLSLLNPGGSGANAAAQLLEICLERHKVEELIDEIALRYPGLFV
jgi:hypothetical protein